MKRRVRQAPCYSVLCGVCRPALLQLTIKIGIWGRFSGWKVVRGRWCQGIKDQGGGNASANRSTSQQQLNNRDYYGEQPSVVLLLLFSLPLFFFVVSFASYKKQATYAWCPTVRTDLNLNTFVLAETHRELSRDENTHTHTHIWTRTHVITFFVVVAVIRTFTHARGVVHLESYVYIISLYAYLYIQYGHMYL